VYSFCICCGTPTLNPYGCCSEECYDTTHDDTLIFEENEDEITPRLPNLRQQNDLYCWVGLDGPLWWTFVLRLV
jgi:hypothetical protein